MPPSSKSRPSSKRSSHCTSSPVPLISKKKRRQATLYDAVAGRVSTTGFLPPHSFSSKNRDTASSTTAPAPPQDVLFRRRAAPVRYEEDDIYWADRHLAAGIELPDSDLLKAVHAYAADFYGRRGGKRDFASLDETALMGVGVLLEEWAEVVLGREGEGVFVEGEVMDEGGVEGRSEEEGMGDGEDIGVVGEEEEGRARKRRRIKSESDEHDEHE